MTKKTISDWAKKNFLHWFVENYLQESEVIKQVLLQIAQNEPMLAKVHIVVDGSYLRPLLVISTEGTNTPSFLLKTFDSTITNPTLILSRLQLLKDSPIYLTLYFPDRNNCEPLQAVIEENPKLLDSNDARQMLMDFELSLWSETIKHDIERQEIMAQIDKALDERNKRKFKRLVKQLKELKP
jgi:uncharacterized protein YpiB (UPF0302 family)